MRIVSGFSSGLCSGSSRAAANRTRSTAEAIQPPWASIAGPLFMVGGPTGSTQTGPWVTDGLQFFLVDISKGRPGTTVGSATVFLVTEN